MSQTKRNALLLLVIAGILTLLLAMSLPNLTLSPGEAFSLEQPQLEIVGASTLLPAGNLLIVVVQGFLALALIFLPVYVIYNLLNAQGRKRLLANVLLLVLLFLIAQYLQDHPLVPPETQAEQQSGELGLNEEFGTELPPTVFTAEPPAWLTPVIVLLASAFVAGLLLTGYWLVQRRRKIPESSLDKLAEAAQNTIESIQQGGDFKMSVIRCYQEMMYVVQQEKGIARETAMTAREFEDRLVGKGLPQEAIRTLTRLFEQVRYGSLPPSNQEETLALASLTDIVKACGGRYEGQ